MYVFLGTWRTSRGGLGAGIEVYDKDEIIKMIKKEKESRHWFSQFRYAKVNEGCSSLLKEMRLEEFEEIFESDLFTPKEITKFFRKEISDKYGEHAIRNQKQRIPKKDLEIGRVYVADNGENYIYFGRIKGSLYTPEQKNYYYNRPSKTEEFEGYCHRYTYKNNDISKDIFRARWKPEVIKSIKKFIEIKDTIIDVPKILDLEEDGYKLHIEFLDVK